jgi:hypothetical protein
MNGGVPIGYERLMARDLEKTCYVYSYDMGNL